MVTKAEKGNTTSDSLVEQMNMFINQFDTIIDEWVNYFIKQIEETYPQ